MQKELEKLKGLPEENEKLKGMIGPLEKELGDLRNKNKGLLDENKNL